MDEDNKSSFDAIFERNDEWIVTRNVKGKVKVARCVEDESNVFEKTRDWLVKTVDETKQDTFKPPVCDLYKTGRFFIRDLLNCEHKNGYFVCKNLPYVDAFICGTVVSLYPHVNKYSIVVDDGTSNIKCLIDKDSLDSVRENSKDSEVLELDKFDSKSEESIFVEATAMTIRSTKSIKEMVPTFHELSLGNVVKIIGTLSEYNGNRYIFIKKIIRLDTESTYHTRYLDDMINLYENLYEN